MRRKKRITNYELRITNYELTRLAALADAKLKNAKEVVVRATASAASSMCATSVFADASPTPHPHGRIRARGG